MAHAFPSIPLGPRQTKPRASQLTMMVDFGLPLGATEDLLRLTHDAIDLAKVAVGTSALYDEALLKEKIRLYESFDVVPFTGGQFLEYAIWLDRIDEFCRDAKAVGYSAIEVSDNLLDLAPERKRDIISRAAHDHGLRVLGEVGSKETGSSASDLIEDALACLDAGAWKVLVEAAEFFDDGTFHEGLAREILAAVPADQVMFELPGTWIPGIAASDIHSMQVWLLERVGHDVNVGNVAPADVLSFEALRRNLGVKMRFE